MNKGFFFDEEPVKAFKKEKKKKRKKIQRNSCDKCGLTEKSKSLYIGEKTDILIIVSSYMQDISFLKRKLEGIKYTLTFAMQCKTKKNISDGQINYCRNNLKKVIQEIKPKKILTFGEHALKSLIGDKISVTEVNRWVGWSIPDQDYNCFIFPNYDLQYMEGNIKNIVLHKKFDEYLINAINYRRKFKIYSDYTNYFFLLQDVNKIIKYLQTIQKGDIITFDYETTGIKCQATGHEIVCMSICKNGKTYSFPVYNDEDIIFELRRIFGDEEIKKIAHNLQFENRWTKKIFKVDIKGWYWDTQLSTHILDNRSYITGLKFQTYVHFGVVGYDEKVKPYIISNDKSSNSFNRMKLFLKEYPKECLTYCATDSHFSYLLYLKHKSSMDNHLQNGFDLFMESNIILSRLEGIRFNKKLYEKNYKKLSLEIEELHEKILNSSEVNKLENKLNFNYDSNKQLRELLYDVCKWETKNKTKKGIKSVDEVTLKEFNKEFTNNILKRKKLVKIRDTYLEQYNREAVEINNNYYIFPNFPLNIPKTYRSSSTNPNLHNTPVRNELAKKMIRKCFISRQNRQLLELDFKAMEVAISCCYHKDPVMIDYVTNKGDMHKDLCKQLFIRDEKNYIDNLPYTQKKERYWAKNGFVFPEFYGSTCRIFTYTHKKNGYGDVTGNLWGMLLDETKEHLKKNGIKNIFDFQKHVEKIENHFWNTRFKVYQQWKFDNWKKYKERGYIDFLSGFRSTAIMGYNDANNWCVQGSAYHVAQKVLNKTESTLRENNYNSFMLGEIHDSGLFDIDPIEKDKIIKIVKQKVKEVEKEWAWINVPLTIEAELTPINGSWADKEEIKI